jgi:hypothetical protein
MVGRKESKKWGGKEGVTEWWWEGRSHRSGGRKEGVTEVVVGREESQKWW